jgi:hypothetical protein
MFGDESHPWNPAVICYVCESFMPLVAFLPMISIAWSGERFTGADAWIRLHACMRVQAPRVEPGLKQLYVEQTPQLGFMHV